MRITKDEARILAQALRDSIFEMSNIASLTRQQCHVIMDELRELEKRLDIAGEDKRRNGRTSHNSFTDLLKRYKGGEQ